MSKQHYGLPNLRVACGRFTHRASTDRDTVTCEGCMRTIQFATEHFTRTAVEASRLNQCTTQIKERSTP